MQVGTKVRHVREPHRGIGEVIQIRSTAGVDEIVVGWPNDNGMYRPYLRADLDEVLPLHEKLRPEQLGAFSPFLLRVFARWFQARNLLTGELCNQPFQMLPHQVLVANRVINSAHDNRRWLVADDVGLGKTIEAGMIMEVLRKRSLSGRFRCLVVAPAGLASQWQEEMRVRFGRSFARLESDVNQLQHAPLLIASIDTLKNAKKYGEALRTVEPWDLIIFDEAHHLASEKGIERYKFADALLRNKENPKARNVLFLSATPHSGNSAHFANMLQLLREDLFKSEEDASAGDGRLNRVMIRNRKSDVQDAKGKQLFFGVKSTAVECKPNAQEVAFFEKLSAYLRGGYKVAEGLKKQGSESGKANAVGFLMATFRKLASSSRGAIRNALARRRALLAGETISEPAANVTDDRYQGEADEKEAVSAAIEQVAAKKGKKTRQSPIADELRQIDELLSALAELGEQDSKLDSLRKWATSLPAAEKVLIFTEYRGTQQSLHEALAKAFGADTIGLVNGDMKLEQRRDVVRAFNDSAMPRFLISTEAGGEGLNMQKSCHVLVNYDLPWNPNRLQQRIGRVYRYGQKRPVQVYNFKLDDPGSTTGAFIDARVEELLRRKIKEIAARYAEVQNASAEDVESEVLGTVMSNVNIEKLYEEALMLGEEALKETLDRKSDRVDEIMRDPKGMLGLFRGLKRFNLTDYETVAARVSDRHLDFFLKEYLTQTSQAWTVSQDGLLSFGVPKTLRDHAERIAREDPTEARDPLGDRIRRATVSKEQASNTLDCRLLRFGDIAFDAMIEHAQSSDFSSGVASLSMPAAALGWSAGDRGICAIFDLKIIQQSGPTATLLRNDLAAYTVRGGQPAIEADAIFDAFLQAERGSLDVDVEEVKRAYPVARQQAESALARVRDEVLKERGTAEGAVLSIDDYALAWLEAS